MEYLGLVLMIGVVMATDPYCPPSCRCEQLQHQEGVTTNCSGSGLQAIPINLDPQTIYMDLSANSIRTIPANCFDGLYKLAVIKLEDNLIEDIEPFAFQGMATIEELNLRRNSLTVIRENAFAEVSGSPGACGTGLRECRLDLRGNPLQNIESYAFSWLRYLDIHIGHHVQELSISSYAFYGSGDFSHVEIGEVSRLNLYPRAFTNTEHVGVLRFHNTVIPHLKAYHFQGLTQVQKIAFENVQFENMEPSAFSVVDYTIGKWKPIRDGLFKKRIKDADDDLNDIPRFLHCGGSVTFVDSVIPRLPCDAFTDTNLAWLSFHGCHMASIEAHAFRGMSCLRILTLRENRIEPHALQAQSLGHLSNVRLVALTHNIIEVFPAHCFKGSKAISELKIVIPDNLNVLLETNSFSGLHDVKELEIKGGLGASLTLQPDALVHLVNVDKLTIAKFRIENLGEKALHGMSKVRSLALRHCSIANVNQHVFGGVQTSGVEHTHLDTVDCGSCETGQSLREFGRHLKHFSAICTGGQNYMLQETWYQQHCLSKASGLAHVSVLYIILPVLLLLWL